MSASTILYRALHRSGVSNWLPGVECTNGNLTREPQSDVPTLGGLAWRCSCGMLQHGLERHNIPMPLPTAELLKRMRESLVAEGLSYTFIYTATEEFKRRYCCIISRGLMAWASARGCSEADCILRAIAELPSKEAINANQPPKP